jgi:hypothetical protein
MNKQLSANATLNELWAVKDQTAARFKSAADYFAHLQSHTSKSSTNAKPERKKAAPVRRSKTLMAST